MLCLPADGVLTYALCTWMVLLAPPLPPMVSCLVHEAAMATPLLAAAAALAGATELTAAAAEERSAAVTTSPLQSRWLPMLIPITSTSCSSAKGKEGES